MMKRKKVLILVGVAVILLLINPFSRCSSPSDWFSFSYTITKTTDMVESISPNSLTLMSYNVRNGRGLDDVCDYNRIGKIISDASPDVVAIQELDSVTQRSESKHVLGELAEATGLYSTYGGAISYQGGKYGVGILSKEKPIASFNIALPGREEQRTLLVAEFDEYVFCCTHLSLTDEDQVASVPLIKEALKGYNKPVFIAGDFNAEPSSKTINEFCWHADILSDVSLMTFPANDPNICIDYIIQLKNQAVPVQVEATGYVEGDQRKVASDHAPIFTKIVLQ